LRNAIAIEDRGPQFRSKNVVRLLENNGLRGSMGRVGSSGDNAAMESFFSLLQKNVLDTKRWDSREELRLAVVSWIETKYNRRRRQRALGKLTPVEFEMIYDSRRRGLKTINPECQPNRGQSPVSRMPAFTGSDTTNLTLESQAMELNRAIF
jgi:hypothetical protein